MKLPRNQFYMKSSELFESEVYLEEVSDVMCIAQAGKTDSDLSDNSGNNKSVYGGSPYSRDVVFPLFLLVDIKKAI